MKSVWVARMFAIFAMPLLAPAQPQEKRPPKAYVPPPPQKTLPDKPGAYYESKDGFVALPDFDPFDVMLSRFGSKEEKKQITAVEADPRALSFVVVYPAGPSRVEHMRVLRASRMQVTFGIQQSTSGETKGTSNLGGDPFSPDGIEPVEGHQNAYRIRIDRKVGPDLYVLASTYPDESNPKGSVVHLHGCFLVK